ncbi:MAG: EutN/CcmL family microcompartment protein [bacterium]
MKIMRVIGSVVSTVKDEKMLGMKLLIVAPCDLYGNPLDIDYKKDVLVAVDAVGAGENEVVMIATGSSARQTVMTKDKPVDTVIMGIIDSLEVLGKFTYLKEGLEVKTRERKTGEKKRE